MLGTHLAAACRRLGAQGFRLRPGASRSFGASAELASVDDGGASDTEMLTEIKHSVETLCQDFPGEYWRDLDKRKAYPTEFVQTLTRSGFLSVLVPEEYGGGGLGLKAGCTVLETIHRMGCNAGTAHAQMYTMGSLLRHGTPEQRQQWLPSIASGEIRLQGAHPACPNRSPSARLWVGARLCPSCPQPPARHPPPPRPPAPHTRPLPPPWPATLDRLRP